MIVLQLSPYDYQGGAGRIAWYLFNAYKEKGIRSYLAVGAKSQDDLNIIQIEQSNYQKVKMLWQLQKWVQIMLGWENFNYPATRHIPSLLPFKPDLIHAHNLQGRFFDLRALPEMSRHLPMVLTLHDTWLLSGHCAYAIGCDRWMTGCGKCPDLEIHPPVKRDATAFNWSRKNAIYQQARVYVATPSRWLLDQVNHSMLMPAVAKARVITNGVDTSVYHPVNKQKVRKELGLPEDAFVLLYVVASRLKKNSYKDYPTIEAALSLLQDRAPKHKKIIFMGLGSSAETETTDNLEKRFIPHQNDIRQVAKYYQAADVLVHAALADTFPNVVLEALACGTPVVATAIGGIPEQIIDGQTGYLVPAQDPNAMCHHILALLQDEEKMASLSLAAVEDVRRRFLLARMVDEYLAYYQEILADYITL